MNHETFLDGMRRMCGTLAWVVLATALAAQGQPWSFTPAQPGRDTLRMEFVRIPAGSFQMGASGEKARHSDEGPPHEVRISKGFWMGKYEVTQRQWRAVMGENPSYFLECGGRCPVERVSWEDVHEFILRLNNLEEPSGYRYRLPTEAEWEYAARAGTTGARYGELDSIAWYDANSGGTTHPVGLKQANEWGLHDMLGNVWEWTADWKAPYLVESVADPPGLDWGWYWGWYRVNRGGCWSSIAWLVRSANRSHNPSHRFYSIGFRLVREELTEPSQLQEWRNTLGTEFVRIPAGSFQMGPPKVQLGRRDDDDQREVRITEGFWLGKYEVTQREWVALMGPIPSHRRNRHCRERMCPVVNVSWKDAQEFIDRLNDREAGSGYQYRLPTEAEWEYAARAGTADYGEIKYLAWKEGFKSVPRPVGLKQPNAWGLHDMLGNVWEWTADSDAGSTVVSHPRGDGTVARGVRISWLFGRPYIDFQGQAGSGGRNGDLGFRLVRTE